MNYITEDHLKLVQSYVTDISSKLTSLDPSVKNNIFALNHAFIVSNIVYRVFQGLKNRRLINEIPFLVGFMCVLATGLGGAIINALLQAKTQIFFTHETLMIYFICAWILTLYFPLGLVRLFTSFPPLELILYAIEGVFVGDIVVGAVDDAVLKFPQSSIAPIVIATLSACGGQILRPFIMNQYVAQPVESTILSEPSIAIKVPFILSIFYYVTTHVIELRSYTYTIQQGKTSIRVDITPELIVVGSFVLLYLYYFSKSFTSRFLTTEGKKTTIDTKGIESPNAGITKPQQQQQKNAGTTKVDNKSTTGKKKTA